MKREMKREENNSRKEKRAEGNIWFGKQRKNLSTFCLFYDINPNLCSICSSLVRYNKKIFGEVLGDKCAICIQNECRARTTL